MAPQPAGPTRKKSRSPSNEWVMLTVTLTVEVPDTVVAPAPVRVTVDDAPVASSSGMARAGLSIFEPEAVLAVMPLPVTAMLKAEPVQPVVGAVIPDCTGTRLLS